MKTRSKRTKKALLYILIKLSIIGILLFIVFYFILTVRICQSNDLYPNIKDGDLVVFYKFGKLGWDDVVLYKDSSGKERYGRIVAISGDSVNVTKDRGLIINEVDAYNTLPYKTEPQEKLDYPITLKQDEYFILSDLRDQVKDSRTFGAINKSQIIGKEVFLMRRRSF